MRVDQKRINFDWLGCQLYLFDLDDTLLMTRAAIRASWRKTLQHPMLTGKGIDAVSYTHLTLPTKRIV